MNSATKRPRPTAAATRAMAAAVALSAGCTVGPDYEAPQPTPPPAWDAASRNPDAGLSTANPPDVHWWRRLGDACLETLIERALRANPTLEQATLRVREARSLLGVAEGRLLPQVGTSASYQAFQFSEDTPLLSTFFERPTGGLDRRYELYSGLFDATWELDVFGGSRRGVQAAEARMEATCAQAYDVQRSVVAEVARNYFHLRGSQRQLALLQRNIDLLAEGVRLMQIRHDSGVGTGGEVATARGRLGDARADLAPLRATVAAVAYRVAVLTDQAPAEVFADLRTPRPLPAIPDAVPVGLPGDLLRRRPDIRAAERLLAAATADIGVQVAQLYPSFSLTGSAGLQAQSFPDLFRDSSGAWLIGPVVRWPIFQGGRIRAAIDAAGFRADAALVAYRAAVQRALADAETALTRYGRAVQRHGERADALQDYRRAADIAAGADRAGVASRLDAVRADSRATKAEVELARAHVEVLEALAGLNKALGGTWDLPEEPARSRDTAQPSRP